MERWICSRVQSTVGCFAELCFIQFSVVQVHVGSGKQFIGNFVFLPSACAAGFNNKDNLQSYFIYTSEREIK